jgi:hypothetical protein
VVVLRAGEVKRETNAGSVAEADPVEVVRDVLEREGPSPRCPLSGERRGIPGFDLRHCRGRRVSERPWDRCDCGRQDGGG